MIDERHGGEDAATDPDRLHRVTDVAPKVVNDDLFLRDFCWTFRAFRCICFISNADYYIQDFVSIL